MKIFEDIKRGIFLDRPNRFTVRCRLNGRDTVAYLPNPGRLWELLLPGREIYLVRNRNNSNRHTDYTVVAVKREGVPVMLHTHLTNTVARWMIETGKIKEIEGYRVLRAEPAFGSSRFDFLLAKDSEELVLEVKSCTLFHDGIAMFPDAVTQRGARHLRELASLRREGKRTGLLFVVHWPRADYFLPDYHTDLNFARTLYEHRDYLMVRAVGITWRDDLTLSEDVRELTIPWKVMEGYLKDSGCYILILRLDRPAEIQIGNLGRVDFRQGYYLYVGSAKKRLTSRLQRHSRKRKRLHWHIDYLREKARFHAALPIREPGQSECEISEALEKISNRAVKGFGSSDCGCKGHLFAMHDNPLKQESFINLLLRLRTEILARKIGKG